MTINNLKVGDVIEWIGNWGNGHYDKARHPIGPIVEVGLDYCKILFDDNKQIQTFTSRDYDYPIKVVRKNKLTIIVTRKS